MLKLRELRLQNGYTQKQMAELLNLSTNGYQNYELGTREPSLQILCKIADILGVSLDYLLGRENEKAVAPKGTTDVATNFIKELKLENDKRFKDLAKLYAHLPDMHRTYILAYLIGYLNSSGINTINIIGY